MVGEELSTKGSHNEDGQSNGETAVELSENIQSAKNDGNGVEKYSTKVKTDCLSNEMKDSDQISYRRSSRKRSQPGRYSETIEYKENDFSRKKRPPVNTENKALPKKVKKSHPPHQKPQSPPLLVAVTSLVPGEWIKSNNELLNSICRRPIPYQFYSSKECETTYESIQFGTGKVTAWCPSINRTPDLYRIEYMPPHNYSEDITYEELKVAIASEKKRLAITLSPNDIDVEKDKIKKCRNNKQQRADEALRTKALSYLPELCAVAAWDLEREAKWKEMYEKALEDEKQNDMASKGVVKPLYYDSRHPILYVRDLNNESTSKKLKQKKVFSFSSSQIGQNVKHGCSVAFEYCNKIREKELGILHESSRRNTRKSNQKIDECIRMPSENEVGGLVANFILNALDLCESVEFKSEKGVYYINDNSTSNIRTYFDPSDISILEYLGKNSGNITGKDIQNSILILLDQQLIVSPSKNVDTTVNLMLAEEFSTKELKESDGANFGRCKFHTRENANDHKDIKCVVSDASSSQTRQAPAYSQERKEFEINRFTSIHSRHTIWPSWTDFVSKILSESKNLKSLESEKEIIQIINDEELARSSSSSRRSKRSTRNESDNLVFYGTGSSLTQSQFTDSVHRLIMQANPGFVTASHLCNIVGDVSDPNDWKKVRLALGKLVHKEGRVARMYVNSGETDEPCYRFLSRNGHKSLIELCHQDDKDDRETTEKVLDKTLINEHYDELVQYIHELHLTELYIRSVLLHHSKIQVDTDKISKAADEQEPIDEIDQDNTELEWQDVGHDLLGVEVLRPGGKRWIVKKYIPSQNMDSSPTATEIGKDSNKLVERRIRFLLNPKELQEEQEELVLTEGQVRAGHEANKLKKVQSSKIGKDCFEGHQFKDRIGTNIILSIPSKENNDENEKDNFEALVIGIDGALYEDQKVLLLLDEADKNIANLDTCVWGTLEDTGLSVHVVNRHGEEINLSIENHDFESDSPAYSACLKILDFLYKHKKSSPFREPVDPEEFDIPDYFDIIKNPMDISTVEKKLNSGVYSKIVLKALSGNKMRNPVRAMVEGPFKDDVMLIFDNAMEFNSEESWVHKDAQTLKNATLKKINKILEQSTGDQEINTRRKEDDSDSAFDEEFFESDDDEYDDAALRRKNRRRKGRSKRKNHGDVKAGNSSFSSDLSTSSVEIQCNVPYISKPFADMKDDWYFSALNINTNAMSYTLPSRTWLCRHKSSLPTNKKEESDVITSESIDQNASCSEVMPKMSKAEEIFEIMNSRVRRSQRASGNATRRGKRIMTVEYENTVMRDIEYFLANEKKLKDFFVTKKDANVTGEELKDDFSSRCVASDRAMAEEINERLHEEYYAKLYYLMGSTWKTRHNDSWVTSEASYGQFYKMSFPPYLGRISQDGRWEIRSPYVAPALRWVIRGLVASGHIVEVEPMMDTSSDHLVPLEGSVIIANGYYWNNSIRPYDIVETKKPSRQKQINDMIEEEKKKADAKRVLSDYEKMRAERVARNQEKLRSLGLG